MDIVERKNDSPVNVGDTIYASTEYSGDVKGVVIKQTFNLNGGTLVKQTIMKGTI